MSFTFAPEAQPIIDNFITNGAKSFEKMGTIEELRNLYEHNCKLCAMPNLEHIYTEDHIAQIDHYPISLRIYDISKDVKEARPTVLFIHGGGWVIGNLNTHDSICRKIADSGKVRIIALDYRLAPEHKFPIPFEDCQRALQYIMQNAANLHVDTNQMIFMGDSAGANMAAHLGQAFHLHYQKKLKAQILLYPVIGYLPNTPSYQDYQSGLPLVKDTMLWFFDQLTSHPNQLQQLSLLNGPFDKNNGDVLLLTVEHDPLRDEALILINQLVKNGINVEYHHLNGLMHGIFTLAGKLPIAENYLEKIGKYIIQKIHQGNKE
ncbi:alpha/beta hydrolase [Acinetobacter radioresistens]|uniref:alpha/beta hydrolase n=1 Tax=Acinetobacter radioresistens TaxID=40216 RepID=UPI000946832B|nr:alpha/beta hydrolase [Acinetobacter radioresistens]